MKFRRSIIFASAVAIAAVACTKYIFVYSVGEADNAIILSAGFADSSSAPQTKADPETPEAGANHLHSTHLGFATGNKMRLRVAGTWTGHGSETVSKETVATLGEATDKHNPVTAYDPQLYWDDYGTADPANASTGRTAGLTIYGVAVNDASVDAPAVSSWTDLSWTLPENQSGVGDGAKPWSEYDLLISNNVRKVDESHDNRYKFSEHNTGKLLEFTHAMSKITIQLTPGSGFNNKFETAPEVKFLTLFKMSGTVDVESGTVSAPGDDATAGSQKLRYTAPATNSNVYTFDGLVMPGNTVRPATENVNFIEVTADGNKYTITTEKLADAMSTAQSGNMDYKSGKEYIVKIQVGKTGVNVTATIADWSPVEADPVNPSINVSANYGTGDASNLTSGTSFSFFVRQDELESDLYGSVLGDAPNQYYAEDDKLKFVKETNKWGLVNGLYWPDHNTHLHMRGVFPEVGAYGNTDGKPVVTGDAPSNQCIALSNVAYAQGSYPSDLMIGYPVVGDNDKCSSTIHTQVLLKDHGICATSGNINLTFKYMMSQVEVRLKTSESAAVDHVDLTNAEVSIVGLLNSGSVTIDKSEITTSGIRENYTLNTVASDRNGIAVANIRHSAIIPQPLTYESGGSTKNVRLCIQLKGGASHDVNAAAYYVENLPNLMNGTTAITPNKRWEPGKHYVYTLDVRKTGIEVRATIVDWVEAQAETDVWM